MTLLMPLPPQNPSDANPITWVVCLCADWCGLCSDYRPVFQQVAAQQARLYPDCRFAWVDIEEQADWVGDMDIETFPTLLVADGHGVLFFGPLMPHAETLSRLLLALQTPGVNKVAHSMLTENLLSALHDMPELWL